MDGSGPGQEESIFKGVRNSSKNKGWAMKALDEILTKHGSESEKLRLQELREYEESIRQQQAEIHQNHANNTSSNTSVDYYCDICDRQSANEKLFQTHLQSGLHEFFAQLRKGTPNSLIENVARRLEYHSDVHRGQDAVDSKNDESNVDQNVNNNEDHSPIVPSASSASSSSGVTKQQAHVEDYSDLFVKRECHICHTVFTTRQALCRHMREQHQKNTRRHECSTEKCNAKFKRKLLLTRHEKKCKRGAEILHELEMTKAKENKKMKNNFK